MTWHTGNSMKTCKLRSLNSVFRAVDNAVQERVDAIEYTGNVHTQPEALSQGDFTGNTDFQRLSHLFLHPKYAEKALAADEEFTCQLPTVADKHENYLKETGFKTYSRREALLEPKPSAEVLDSWYRYINGLVYIQGEPVKGVDAANASLIWRVTYKNGLTYYGSSPTSYEYDFWGEREKGKTCYIRVYVSKNHKEEYLGVLGEVTPTEAQREHTVEAYDSFLSAVQALSENILETSCPENKLLSGRLHHNDEPAEDRYYRNSYSELVDIGAITRQADLPGGYTEVVSYTPLSHINGIDYTITYNGKIYQCGGGKPLPGIDTRINGYDSSYNLAVNIPDGGSQIFEKPIKLDLKYYDPPEEE